jgi:NAD-dependent SIR2 family protein deacetylase
MPSEKAKENKTLTAQCAACGKTVSTELIHGVLIERDGKRTTVPVCDECRQTGWEPALESG